MEATKKALEKPVKEAAKEAVVTLVPSTRSQNVQIMLARWKLSFVEIREALLRCDSSFVSQDRIEALRRCCPTEEEAGLIRGYTGDRLRLGYTERFFDALLEVPRLPIKLESLNLLLSLGERVGLIVEADRIMRIATEEVRKSKVSVCVIASNINCFPSMVTHPLLCFVCVFSPKKETRAATPSHPKPRERFESWHPKGKRGRVQDGHSLEAVRSLVYRPQSDLPPLHRPGGRLQSPEPSTVLRRPPQRPQSE